METTPTPRERREPLARLVDELLQVGAVLSEIVEHMALAQISGQSPPGAPPVRVVLTELLQDVLEPLADEGTDTLAAAADIVSRARAEIAEEVMLVPLDGRLAKF